MSLRDFSSVNIDSRIMWLDLGKRRIGVAVSDSLGWTAQGVEVIDRKGINWRKQLELLVSSPKI